MKRLVSALFNKFGYTISKSKDQYPDLENEFWDIYNLCKSETMTSVERMYALYKAVEYVHHQNIEGDYVECGVWRGGSTMLAAITLNRLNDTHRHLYLYDTYEGMSEPTTFDVSVKNDEVHKEWSVIKKSNEKIFAYASLATVQTNMLKTKYPESKIKFIVGKVEDTIPNTITDKISLLRLDTDWYESTKHELEHLFPKLQSGGILIIDDYGHWKGSRKAVDEYFSANKIIPYLHRIDYTGRLYVKP